MDTFLSVREGPSEGPGSAAALWNERRLGRFSGLCFCVSVERLEPGLAILSLKKRLSLQSPLPCRSKQPESSVLLELEESSVQS